MVPVEARTSREVEPKPRTSAAGPRRRRGRAAWKVLGGLAAAYAALVLSQYPYNYDEGYSAAEIAKTLDFYRQAYQAPAPQAETPDDDYVKVAAEAAQRLRIPESVASFAQRYQLAGKQVLEVGAGRGYLQDIVAGYTALDIAPTARRFFHKPFVLGSATAMPFPDNHYDAIWTVWVLEHVPNPEQALREIRRVAKDGAVVYLLPAWDVAPWAAQGYKGRPYSDFNLAGKVYKWLIPFRSSYLFYLLTRPQVRSLRAAWTALAGGPTTLHYRRLTPNYRKYWEADSDAVNSLDRAEVARWFTSRGDDCLSGAPGSELPGEPAALVIRVHKR